MDVFVGTSGYSYREWKGSFYPSDLPAAKWLGYYADHLPAVEINNTFYRFPKRDVLAKWAQEVPSTFRFAVKASRRITHEKRLKDCAEALKLIGDAASAMESKLGPMLFQCPPFLRKDVPRLQAFLRDLPKSFRSAFEFRHESWNDPAVLELLRSHNIALVTNDENLDTIEVTSTANWGYVRLRQPYYDDDDLQAWIARMKQEKWKEAYVFFKHDEKATTYATRFNELARA